jgi:preprotein translocase subunit SecA
LEYDDVANHQRKAIYAFRNQLLDPEFDIASKIKENRGEYVDHLLMECEIFDGMPTEDFNIEKLTSLIKEELNIEMKKCSVSG